MDSGDRSHTGREWITSLLVLSNYLLSQLSLLGTVFELLLGKLSASCRQVFCGAFMLLHPKRPNSPELPGYERLHCYGWTTGE